MATAIVAALVHRARGARSLAVGASLAATGELLFGAPRPPPPLPGAAPPPPPVVRASDRYECATPNHGLVSALRHAARLAGADAFEPTFPAFVGAPVDVADIESKLWSQPSERAL